ncbi:arginine--tRNA ligase [Sulfolobales archaeon HS-7]|nr:arginine--tRNA ligase [Sulfolobales archaeon HS-7]
MSQDLIEEAMLEMSEILEGYTGLSREIIYKKISEPPRKEFGDLSTPLKGANAPDKIIGKKYIKEINKVGIYYNAVINVDNLFSSLFSQLDDRYGFPEKKTGRRTVVEHTSANPIHPLHIGALRNAVIGDALARFLSYMGDEVTTRFYVNDSGRQVGVLAYGLEKLHWPSPLPSIKADYFYGLVYASTSTIVDIVKLSKTPNDKGKIDELVAIAKELSERFPEFWKLKEEIEKDADPEAEINRILKEYEEGNNEYKERIRKFVNEILNGFNETLSNLGVSFNFYDYESELLWSGKVKKIIDEILSSPHVIYHKDAKAISFEKLPEDVKDILKIPRGLKIPPLVVTRKDGTSLYTIRDIAYTLEKFKNSDLVINVIAEEQTIPQIQLRAALYLLGFTRIAENLYHYSYAMVNLEGTKMSGRRGRYVTIDELFNAVESVVKQKILEKNGDISTSASLARSAIRYAILSASATKPLSFSVNRVTDLNENSGPYLQYTYVRANSIMSKFTGELNLELADTKDIVNTKRDILISIAKFPYILKITYESLQLENLTIYIKNLADLFNSWYSRERILQEEDERKKTSRLYLVKGVKTVLGNSFNALGIDKVEKM